MKNRWTAWMLLVVAVGMLAGCGSGGTNAPTANEIKEADDARIKAIENDPSYTPAQKQAAINRIKGSAR